MDRALNGAMSASLRRGLYPTGPGTNQAFLNVTANPDNPWQPPRPAAVIVAGLGPEGELRGSDLVHSIRQAVIGWAQHLTESHPVPTGFTLATTLLGSGGCGITAGQAAQLIAQGVREANQQLALGGARPPWPRVDRLKIIELYLDRANEAWNALQALAASSPELYAIDPMIAPGTGALRRPAEAGYRGADYDFISAFVINTEDDTDQIGYTINSKRARNEVRTQPMQIRLISNLVKTASDHTDTDTEIGRTLFTLLVPADLEAFLGGRTETVLELDDATSAIPWEILESPTSSDQNAPWSIRTKLLRKLRTATPTLAVNSATADDGILVIGDPACDRNQYPVLWGARQEAAEVAKCLTAAIAGVPDREGSGGARVTAVISGPNAGDPEPDAATVINQVVPKSWRIIHVAGHGEPPITDGKRTDTRGVVLSGGLFLGAQEIAALRVKPELVFVNCCHLAADDPNPQFKPTNYDRVQFASGVAHALIKGGVRCVVAAGWAVDDDAASVFATAFYQALLAGARFIDAVAAAREKAYGCGGNTWAAYQCYGDPDWQFTAANADAQRPRASPGQEFAGIASAPSLMLALERIAVESEYQGRPSDLQAERLGHLETTFGHYLDRGDVAAAFGNAWSKSGRFAKAIDWYERARLAQDGTASLVAIEQLANLRIRQAWNSIKDDPAPPATAINQAREAIRTASGLLDTMLALAPTYERESIRGSGFKRLAMLEAKAGRPDQETTAIKEMYKHYSAAETMARKTQAHPFFYPAMNRIAAQLALFDGAKPLDQTEIKALQESMSSVPPDFWSVVGQTELELFVSVSDGRLSEAVDRLIKGFREHYLRVSNPRMWGSVLDNATFVLSRYQRCAKPSEAMAADRLIGELKARANGLTFAAPEDGIGTTTTPRPRPEAGEARSTIGRHRGSGPARRAGSSKGGR